MIVDFATGKKIEGDIRLHKGSDYKKFTEFIGYFVLRGYDIAILNITIKFVPRIGKVVTYFAELKKRKKAIDKHCGIIV